LAEVKSYFDRHTHDDAYHKGPDFYFSLIEHLKKQFNLDEKIKILDVGCGDGNFIKDMISSNISADFIGMDISLKMINIAKDSITHHRVELINADGFNIPLKSDHKFDLIHIDCVLHHLIGKTRSDSIRLSDQILRELTNRLSENGILIVEEWIYVSYFIPQLTSTIIFYGLKLLNFLHLDITKIVNEIKPGLEVNFLHGKEIENLLKRNGTAIFIEKRMPHGAIPKLYRCFLLKDLEYISFIARAQSVNTQ
jgi:SAM-dependent methyltransferase